jgi:hypothetical protein
MEGRTVAGDTFRRPSPRSEHRSGIRGRVKEISENPPKHLKAKRTATADRIDPRVVVTHAQARELFTAVSYVGSWDRARGRRLVAFFAVCTTPVSGRLRPSGSARFRLTRRDLLGEPVARVHTVADGHRVLTPTCLGRLRRIYAVAVLSSRRHPCHQRKLVHTPRGRNRFGPMPSALSVRTRQSGPYQPSSREGQCLLASRLSRRLTPSGRDHAREGPPQ